MDYRIIPPEEMIEATVMLPLSKSVSNRQLIINALTPGAVPLKEIARCDDSSYLQNVLAGSRSSSDGGTFNVGAAGTALRFLTAFFAVAEGKTVTLDGTERLRQRPIAPLVDSLRKLGAEIEYAGEAGHAPLKIKGRKLHGGEIEIDPSVSSQFVSALMMIGPTMETPLKIRLTGEIISRPYIMMTKALMEQAGADIEFERDLITVKPSVYRDTVMTAERDWSAASYWYEITALSAGFITLPGLDPDSLQGDKATAGYFQRLGVITNQSEEIGDALELSPDPEQYSRFEQDLSDNPDIAQTLAVTSAMLGIPFHLRGLSTLTDKETDRLAALQTELDRLGFIVEIRNGAELVWNGERHPIFEIPRIETYDDHRMAMAFAPAALYIPGLVICNAEVVTKSYPGFWDDLKTAGFTIVDTAMANRPETEEEAKN